MIFPDGQYVIDSMIIVWIDFLTQLVFCDNSSATTLTNNHVYRIL